MDRKTEEAAIERQYREVIKPTLENRRAKLDPAESPVEVVFLDAYMVRWEGAVFGNSIGDAARNEMEEIEELAPWVNPSSEITADVAHDSPLSEIMHDAGMSIRDVYETIEQARKRNRGRPIALCAIKALEMRLAGKSDNEIADALCDYSMEPHKRGETRRPHSYGDMCSERYRKEIEKLSPLYEKYKPRN